MTASASQAFSAQCVCLKVESAKMLEQRDSHAAEGFFQEIHPDVLRVWSAEGLGKFDSDCIEHTGLANSLTSFRYNVYDN